MSTRIIRHAILAFTFCSAVAMAQQYTISTLAGNGTAGFVDGSALGGAQFNFPAGITVDSSGKIYIADTNNYRVRAISGGTVNTVAGNGTKGYTGDSASATAAELQNPNAVAVDGSGNIYIADTDNQVIRKVSGGTITTYAGIGVPANQGDNGLATGAALWTPSGLAVDSQGNLYIADTGNNEVRKVDHSTQYITAVVGTKGTAVTLNHPTGIAIDSAGVLYIADTNNQRIVKWASNKLTTIAGTGTAGFSGDGGPATKAMLHNPIGVAVDAAGNVYIADSSNSRIRKVSTDGTISTIAGNGKLNWSGDGGPATSAGLYFPRGVAVDSQGNVYVADTSNHVIRVLQGGKPTISDGGVTNAASYAQQISAGALATVWGQNFGGSSGVTNAPWPATFDGVSVSVNGNPAPIYYVSPGQINFQVPWNTATGTATVTVSLNNSVSNTMNVAVVNAGPGLFLNGSAAIVENQDYSVNGPSNPAAAGSTIIAYLTGSGPVAPAMSDGVPTPSDTLVKATSAASAKIGSSDAQVSFTGLAPGFIGLVQMNIVVPAGLAPGDYPLTVTIDGEASNSANISIK